MLNPQAFINEVAVRWCRKHPTQASKIMHAAMLVFSEKVEPRSCESWRVKGSKGNIYLVEVTCGYHRCDCLDFKFRKEGERCYHCWLVAFTVRLNAELQSELSPKTLDSFVEAVPPPPKKEKLSEALGELCQKLHLENHKRAAQVKPCPVIDIRKGERL